MDTTTPLTRLRAMREDRRIEQTVLDCVVTHAQRSEYGVARTGEALFEAQAVLGRSASACSDALLRLRDRRLVDLREWGPFPAGEHLWLAPETATGTRYSSTRPLLKAPPATADDPIVAYHVVMTFEVDHPERRDATLPKVEPGYRYDFKETYGRREAAEKHIAALRAGRGSEDFGSEYCCEMGVSVATLYKRHAGWLILPEPRVRPARM